MCRDLARARAQVVHPEWIKSAISQNCSYLEISAYVLNDLVDEGEIPPYAEEPASTRLSRAGSRNHARATDAAQDNKQKRRHSAIDFSFSALDRRPSKKARIKTPEKDDTSVYSLTISSSPSSSTSEQSVIRLVQERPRPQMKLPRLSKQYNPVELFERRITRQIMPGGVRPK
ncbi:uncharacterized protein SCHCODRAFT_02497249 [Schizophyllum commune H4-8]|uniref:Expressed protein n=1 Tax=Schizophyllum commune (strain H4-8 / FGSC 9210) TaxID=578458 RepID=D8Q233_SCHCM|nr:uncharacterized protein SCHCODRAFT_02497249 [Schizophyllum commune H4-8]KAI5895695.1 hypothetical protein SCHCODRAFT_02497249 [Schizophyllum commune H4-8]